MHKVNIMKIDLYRHHHDRLGAAVLKTVCSECNLRNICLPAGLSCDELDQFDEMVHSRIKVKRGEVVYRAGSAFSTIFAIHSGFFKSRVTTKDGREQVTSFSMAGDILGLDGIGNGEYQCDAVALEDGEICFMPYSHLEKLAHDLPSLQRNFHKIMSREIVREADVMLLLGLMRAEERLAVFLLNLSQRFNARGYSALEFNLRMTREEIGSYLGLKLETVSRTFSNFQMKQLVQVNQKNIRLLDVESLGKVFARHH